MHLAILKKIKILMFCLDVLTTYILLFLQPFQVLISGAQVPINLEDLKTFTNYSGKYMVNKGGVEGQK